MPTRILIADDNPIFRAALRQVLEASGRWEIIETCDGQEAVAQAVETRPHLIILDLAMPVKDGFAAACEISKLLPEIPILMCTLHATSAVALEAQKFGIRRLVSKSESIEIVAAIRQILAHPPPASLSAAPVLPDIGLPAPEIIPAHPPLHLTQEAAPSEPDTHPGNPGPEKVA